jgi:acyl-CoA synthetase (AMP-forming)/AMP-acid ligase II
MSWTPPQRLLHDSLLASAERTPDKTALVTEDERLTYEQLCDRSLRIARALQDEGLARGDRVALYLDNTADLPAALFGTLLAGGVFMVVNPQTKADKLGYVLSNSEASFLFADHALVETAEQARRTSPSRSGQHRRVPTPRLRRPDPRRFALGLRLRALPALDGDADRGHARARALLCLSG